MTAKSAHRTMVNLIMEALKEASANGLLGGERFASAAIEIAAKLKGENRQFLIVNGDVYHISHVDRAYHDKRFENCEAWWVYTPEAEAEQVCIWCGSPYGTAEVGAPHTLCRRCYRVGPEED